MRRILLMIIGAILGLTSTSPADDFRDRLERHTHADAHGGTLPYRLMKPAGYDAAKKYPLVVFLHGAGERGEDNDAQLVHGVREFASDANRKKYPCFLVAPQCPKQKRWVEVDWSSKAHDLPEKPAEPLQQTLELVEALSREFPLDPERIYITGLSMGGYGTWDAIARRPDLFAAAVPVCGGGDVRTAERIRNVAVWAFHGDKDGAVPVSRSRDMIAALEKAGAHPKYTEYPGVGHNSWDKAYADPEMMKWLFARQRVRAPR